MSPRAKEAAAAILAFLAALIDLIAGLVLIFCLVFGVYAFALLLATGELPPQFAGKAIQAYVFLAATAALLSIWSQGAREKREQARRGRSMLGWRK